MADELEQLLNGDDNTKSAPPVGENKGDKPEISLEQQKVNEELEVKRRQLEDLDKAKTEALAELSRIRKDKQKAKQDQEGDDIPKINMEDPSAKAWDKHIRDTVQPSISESEKEKAEILDTEVKKFLSDKPALAKDSAKLKEMMESYEALSSGKITGKVPDKVAEYLNKAYAATNHQQIFEQIKSKRIAKALDDEMFSDAGVSSGGSGYSEESEIQPKLSQEQREILAKWDMTPQEWIKMKKEHSE
jgi:hypothetical protein